MYIYTFNDGVDSFNKLFTNNMAEYNIYSLYQI